MVVATGCSFEARKQLRQRDNAFIRARANLPGNDNADAKATAEVLNCFRLHITARDQAGLPFPCHLAAFFIFLPRANLIVAPQDSSPFGPHVNTRFLTLYITISARDVVTASYLKITSRQFYLPRATVACFHSHCLSLPRE